MDWLIWGGCFVLFCFVLCQILLEKESLLRDLASREAAMAELQVRMTQVTFQSKSS